MFKTRKPAKLSDVCEKNEAAGDRTAPHAAEQVKRLVTDVNVNALEHEKVFELTGRAAALRFDPESELSSSVTQGFENEFGITAEHQKLESG